MLYHRLVCLLYFIAAYSMTLVGLLRDIRCPVVFLFHGKRVWLDPLWPNPPWILAQKSSYTGLRDYQRRCATLYMDTPLLPSLSLGLIHSSTVGCLAVAQGKKGGTDTSKLVEDSKRAFSAK